MVACSLDKNESISVYKTRISKLLHSNEPKRYLDTMKIMLQKKFHEWLPIHVDASARQDLVLALVLLFYGSSLE